MHGIAKNIYVVVGLLVAIFYGAHSFAERTLSFEEHVHIYNGPWGNGSRSIDIALQTILKEAGKESGIVDAGVYLAHRDLLDVFETWSNMTYSLEYVLGKCEFKHVNKALLQELFAEPKKISVERYNEVKAKHDAEVAAVEENNEICVADHDYSGDCRVSVVDNSQTRDSNFVVSMNAVTCPSMKKYLGDKSISVSIVRLDGNHISISDPQTTTHSKAY
jgi:hypothetical protein